MQKTNAMRILDSKKIAYTVTEYDTDDGKIDGMSVAAKVCRDPSEVFKTLVTQSQREIIVFVIPVNCELDLKKAARCSGRKSIEMLPLKQLFPTTGYIHGGCTALGMKKNFPVYLEETAILSSEITVSAGKVGMQITLDTDDYITASGAVTGDLIRDD